MALTDLTKTDETICFQPIPAILLAILRRVNLFEKKIKTTVFSWRKKSGQGLWNKNIRP